MEYFDIVIVVFNKISLDARAYNLANTLIQIGKKVLVISLTDEINNSNYDFQNFTVKISNFRRVYPRWLIFSFLVNQILRRIKYKYLVASDLYALPVCSLNKINVLFYDSREIYSELASLENRKIAKWIIKSIEKKFIKNVDKIIVTSVDDKTYLSKHLTNNKLYIIIKNLPPYKEKINSNYLRDKLKIPSNEKIFIYQGMIQKGRGIFNFIDAIQELENIRFILIGENNITDELNKYINSKKIKDKVHILEPVPYSNLYEVTTSADIGIALFEPISISYKLALPNKLFEYILAGLPILATNLPSIKEIIENNNIGLLVNNIYDKNELKEKINLIINTKVYNDLKQNIEMIRNIFTYESQIDIIKENFN